MAHTVEKGNVVVVTPGSSFRFEPSGKKPLTALLHSNPHLFPVEKDEPAVVSVSGGESEMSVCGFKNFIHDVERPYAGGTTPCAHAAVLDISAAPEHEHDYTHETYFFLQGKGGMKINGVDHKVKPGTLIVLPPRTRHAAYSDDKTKSVIALMTFHPGLRRRGHPDRDEYIVHADKPSGHVQEFQVS